MIPYIQQHIAAGGRAWRCASHAWTFPRTALAEKVAPVLEYKRPRLNDAEALIEGAIEFRTDSSLRLADIQ